jgi:hypothetical protein
MRAGFCVFAIALVTGCGGDDGVAINTNASNVCDEIAEVACHNLYGCCTENEIQDFLGLSEPRTQVECRADVKTSCERRIATLEFSLDQNRVRFDANIMNNCLAALVAPDGSCAEVVPELPWTEACMESAWVGTVTVDNECRYAQNQKCAARPGHGQACGSGCAHEFYCASGICQPRLPTGGVCTSTSQCAEDLFCDVNAPMPVCTARQPGGAACTSSAGCESSQCIPGVCAGPTSGNTCYRDTDCSNRCADDGSFCSTAANCATGTCQISGFSCSSPTACGVGDTCVFPVQCVPGDCVGDPVCTIPQFVVDYCTGALSQLPVL